MSLLPVSEALERILASFEKLDSLHIPLKDSVGRILAEEIVSATDLPLFDNSSMDGFALRASDVTQAGSATPISLPVVDDIPAGKMPTHHLQVGEAARIMTGAPLPPGADAVVPVEETDFNNRAPGAALPESVQIFKAANLGANIRKRGTDIQHGESILHAGQRLRAQDLGMLAMLGVADVPVCRKPRVALLSSGDELTPIGQPLTEGKIYDVNSYTLGALLEAAGCEIIPLGVAADTPEAIKAALYSAKDADLILSSAGVSMGSFDFIKDVIEKEGKLNFWRINMRPGKPLTFGHYQNIPFIGLAGNPVSAFVGFMVFVRPVVEKMLGSSQQAQIVVRARLTEPIQSDGRESYLRAYLYHENGQRYAKLTGHQGSGNLFSMVQANALLIIPPEVKSLPTGAEVTAWLLE
ncbi:MAG: molybdopterin molybdotransferase MoeA [Anaerolineae bacterium]|jgi:molybdopterin molybdotransferase|nr:molybdopterin molybdotransferase MoeA [Anaerolineae bacterium]MBT7071113.1 molybdopterin molybdotransferase MoeA [Anaerolineae bacterium]MBT7324859.1 molybdopterin molybdotransferase MoeA [Anaerolineae bacterium]